MAANMSFKAILVLCFLMCGISAVFAGDLQACTITKPPENCTQQDLQDVWNCTLNRCIAAMRSDCAGHKCLLVEATITSLITQVTVAVNVLIATFTTQALIIIGVTVLTKICIMLVAIIQIILIIIGCVVLTTVLSVTIIIQICAWLVEIITILVQLNINSIIFIQVFIIFKLIFCIIIELIIAAVGF